MKARDAPHDNERIEVTKEMICVVLIFPVLRTMKTWAKHIFWIEGLGAVKHLGDRLGSRFVHRLGVGALSCCNKDLLHLCRVAHPEVRGEY